LRLSTKSYYYKKKVKNLLRIIIIKWLIIKKITTLNKILSFLVKVIKWTLHTTLYTFLFTSLHVKMATIISSYSSIVLVLFFLFVLFFLYNISLSIVLKSFSAEVMHLDSEKSLSYHPSATYYEGVVKAIQRSIARENYNAQLPKIHIKWF